MRAEQAAAYLSMSKSMFLALVKEKLMPDPVYIHSMTTWDRFDLDAAFDNLKDGTGPAENTFDKAMRKLEDAKGTKKRQA